MSNQIVISSGAKVRSLEGVLTGSAGIVSSVPLGGANGVATLDSSGKVPLSQLPASVVTYLGTWNAATNTPTLANGTGDVGDLYICNVAGTVNFGAGPITFAVGDWVIYNGSEWQKSAGQNGTVTSVSVTESGDALNITGSPITTAGTINIGFAGNSSQYINGEGNLTTFPSLITEAQNLVTEVYNETGSTLTKGTIVYINGGHGNLPTVTKAIATGDSTSAQTYGVVRADISNNNNGYVTVIGSLSDINTQAYAAGTQLYLSGTTAGAWTSTKPSAPIHLVYVGIVVRSHPTQGVVEVRIQNGYELEELHDVAISSPLNNQGIFYNSSTDLWENKSIATALGYTPANAATYVPYTGATTNVNLGGYNLTGYTLNGNQGLKVEGYGGEGGYLAFKQYAVNNLLGFGYTSISANSTNILSFLFAQSTAYDAKQFKIDVSGLTDNVWRTYQMPNADGTLALTSDIPSLSGYVPYTGATSNVDLGSHNLTTTGDLFVGSVTAGGIFAETNVGGEGYIYLKGNGTFGILSIYNSIFANGYKYGFDVQGGTTGAAKRAYLDFGSLTNSTTRTYSFPDASGTLALTSDIPSLANYVTTNTNQTISGIKTFSNEQLFGNGITLTGGYITYTSGSFNLTLNTNLLTANRNVFLQDKAGTIALTSDIPSLSGYVPYTGATGAVTLGANAITANNFILNGTTGNTGLYYNSTDNRVTIANYNTSGQIQFEVNGGTYAMAIASNGNIGIGVTSPFAGVSTLTGIAFSDRGGLFKLAINDVIYTSNNLYFDGANWKRIIAGGGTTLQLESVDGGSFAINTAATGTAGSTATLTERFRISAAGNVGIGIGATPKEKFEVAGLNGTLRLYGRSGISNNTLSANIYYNGSAWVRDNSSFGASYINFGAANDTIIFATTAATSGDASERMRITSTGLVGIGTSSPTATLQMNSAADTGIIMQSSAAAYSTYLNMYSLGGGAAVIRGLGSGNPFIFEVNGSERMRISANGNVGIAITNPTALLQVNGGDRETGIRIESTNNASYSMKCTSSGGHEYQLFARSGGTGKLSIYDQTTGAYVWEISNNGLMYSQQSYSQTTGNGANVYVASDGAFVRSVSSIKYKKNVVNYEKGLNELMTLRPVSYESINESEKGKKYAGLIAEEVHDLGLTEFVQYAEDGSPDALAYQNMIALLTKAIQELSAKVTALENKI